MVKIRVLKILGKKNKKKVVHARAPLKLLVPHSRASPSYANFEFASWKMAGAQKILQI